MLSLRKCNNNNKIKNSYIITMVNNTKKRNRRRYFTRQSRKMYGGDNKQSEYNIAPPPPPIQNNEREKHSLFEKIVSIIGQKINDGLDYSIDGIANLVGANPNLGFQTIYNKALAKAKNISNVIINTPLGDKLGNQISDATEKIVGPAVKEVTEIGNKFVEEEMPIAAEMAENAVKLIPVVGQAAAAAEEGLDLVRTVENTAEAAAEATGVGVKAIEDLKEARDSISETFGKIEEAASNGIENATKIPDITTVPNGVQSGGRLLKNYNKTAKLIGGRVTASQLEFLAPYDNSSQKLNYKGGKLRTRRRHKLASNRYR
jgi:hypothetical protein